MSNDVDEGPDFASSLVEFTPDLKCVHNRLELNLKRLTLRLAKQFLIIDFIQHVEGFCESFVQFNT